MTRWFEDITLNDTFPLGEHTFSAEEIIRFATLYDPQYFHTDPELAKHSHFGGLIASGWHTVSVGHRKMVDALFAEEERLRGLGQFLDREVIGKQDFHPAKARALCGGEALQHGHFGEQIGQVGGESRHGQGSRGKTVPPECNSIRPFSPGIAASASR